LPVTGAPIETAAYLSRIADVRGGAPWTTPNSRSPRPGVSSPCP